MNAFDPDKLKYQPHEILGSHDGCLWLWRPGAKEIWAEVRGQIEPLSPCVDCPGLFKLECGPLEPLEYRIFHNDGSLQHDPYAFWPTLGPTDLYLFNSGCHYQLFKHLGARVRNHLGVDGVSFSVWAPAARSVSLVSDFNHWDPRVNPMRSLGESGVWEIFIPGATEGSRYKFVVEGCDGIYRWKADPFALAAEYRPRTASVVARIDRFNWNDQQWLQQRTQHAPLHIYEVHLGSWRQGECGFLNYRELATQLVSYCIDMGFTHVEIMPIAEHPLDESWGYQVTGYYACTSRFGSPEDFQWMVNHLHENNIGIILDWVPGHFPADEHGLGLFDGSALFEYSDPRLGWHPHWNTYIFNYGRKEVANFLIANALFWLEEMHVDGLRVDAVASMLYLDYGRDPGQWLPNRYGRRENLEAIEFIKHCNSIISSRCPSAMIIAEESTAWPGVTHALDQGGLGFTHKWNMGWMNDTLRYMGRDPIFRSHHQNELTFSMIYAFSENFVLPFSHDECVHLKRSLLSKMPGDHWQKAANLRLLYGYQVFHPGAKLLFMGGEFGVWDEWSCKHQLPWHLLKYDYHRGIQGCVRDLNHLAKAHRALSERNNSFDGYEWVDFSDRDNCVISYLRRAEGDEILVVHCFTPQYLSDYVIPLPRVAAIHEIFNTDDLKYGGSGKLCQHPQIGYDHHGNPTHIRVSIAPLSTQAFAVYRP